MMHKYYACSYTGSTHVQCSQCTISEWKTLVDQSNSFEGLNLTFVASSKGFACSCLPKHA